MPQNKYFCMQKLVTKQNTAFVVSMALNVSELMHGFETGV